MVVSRWLLAVYRWLLISLHRNVADAAVEIDVEGDGRVAVGFVDVDAAFAVEAACVEVTDAQLGVDDYSDVFGGDNRHFADAGIDGQIGVLFPVAAQI